MQNFRDDAKSPRKLRYNFCIAENKAYNAKFTEMRE